MLLFLCFHDKVFALLDFNDSQSDQSLDLKPSTLDISKLLGCRESVFT